MATPYLKNKGPLLVDKVRGWFDRLPDWFKSQVTIRVEKQKVDAKIEELDQSALDSELKQEVTDEKLLTNRYLGDGAAGSGNDFSDLPLSQPSQIVITGTGQVADVTETVSEDEIGLVAGPPLQDGSSDQVGDVWVTKTVTAPTFDDKSYRVQIPDLLPQEFRSQVPNKTEHHTIDGTAQWPTLASGELSRSEEQRKVGVKSVTVESRDLTTPPVITGMKYDPQWNGSRVIQTQRVVAAGTKVTQVFGMTDAVVRPIDANNALQETWSVDATPAAFPTVSYREFNPDLQANVTTDQSIVAVSDQYTYVNYDLEMEEHYIDALHKLRRVSKLSTGAVPATYNVYTTQQFTFPGILSYLSFALVSLAAANRREPQYAVGARTAYTAPTSVRNQMDFFITQPALWGLYVWATTDVVFKGLSYSINIGNVLTETWNSIGVTYSGDAYYGNTVDRFNVSATSPSASTYIAAIGSEVAIACSVDKYKRLWVRKTSLITLR
jgi:hypothetical protein